MSAADDDKIVVTVDLLVLAIGDECTGAARVAVLAVAAMTSAQAGRAPVGDLGGVREANATTRPRADLAIDLRRRDDARRILDHQLVGGLVDFEVRDHITGADDHAPVPLVHANFANPNCSMNGIAPAELWLAFMVDALAVNVAREPAKSAGIETTPCRAPSIKYIFQLVRRILRSLLICTMFRLRSRCRRSSCVQRLGSAYARQPFVPDAVRRDGGGKRAVRLVFAEMQCLARGDGRGGINAPNRCSIIFGGGRKRRDGRGRSAQQPPVRPTGFG